MDDILFANSPEPPEPVELDDAMQTDENSQPGKLHPEQNLSHIFKVGAPQANPQKVNGLGVCETSTASYFVYH